MPLDPAFVGRRYPAAATYHVGRQTIADFATALGATNPVHHDREAARAAGHRDVIAPPTFPIVLSLRAQSVLVDDPDLGLDYGRVVHGEQSFTAHQPIHAGDELTADLHVDAIRSMGGNDLLAVRCEITDADGNPVSTARSQLVSRAAS